MRILCVIDDLGAGGAQRQLVQLAFFLQSKGNSVEFLTYHPNNFYAGTLQEKGISFTCLKSNSTWQRLWKFRSFIRKGKFDAVIASYHDQGLIPFKTLSFGSGVNYTAGLHKIRTSPDHGTAFEIAGKNQADATSFKEAVYLALDIYKARYEYKEWSKNPLKIKEKQLESKKGH